MVLPSEVEMLQSGKSFCHVLERSETQLPYTPGGLFGQINVDSQSFQRPLS